MAVMAKSWTDERLGERFDRIDQRFDEVDRRFEQVDRRFEQIDRRFEAVDGRFEQVHVDFRELRGEMNSRFDAMQRLIIQMLVTLIVGFVGVIATLATQL